MTLEMSATPCFHCLCK